jgi:hypothetical protein
MTTARIRGHICVRHEPLSQKMDKATTFSLQYLDAIQETLHIEVSDGEVLATSEKVTSFTLETLASAMRDLFSAETVSSAISGVETYDTEKSIQTAGFGMADDFDAFVKVGMLLGDRVVLWESFVVSQLHSGRVHVPSLLEVACDLVALRKAVELGGVVIVPHPRFWLERFRAYVGALPPNIRVSNEFLGLLNARALLDEGFPIQPYSWQPDFEKVQSTREGSTLVTTR